MEEYFNNYDSYTPVVQQYLDIKRQHEDCLLFFRLGDFYELMVGDAIIASKELEIALAKKNAGNNQSVPMAGVPYHAFEPYLYKLVEKGYKVAICEQLQSPKEAKGIVLRGVTRIVSKGTINEGILLNDKDNNYLASIYTYNDISDISLTDVSTGELYVAECLAKDDVLNILLSYRPSEIIYQDVNSFILRDLENQQIVFTYYNNSYKNDLVEQRFNDYEANASLHLLFNYLEETQKRNLLHFSTIKLLNNSNQMKMDYFTIRNLELLETFHDKKKKGSLLWVLDKTSTASGGRLLKKWITNPLIQESAIKQRLDAVEELTNNQLLLYEIDEELKKVYDLERLISKLSFGTINAKDLISLKISLESVPFIKHILSHMSSEYLQILSNRLENLSYITDLIKNSIVDNPPISIREGGMIKEGYNEELDQCYFIKNNSKQWLMEYENEQKRLTGISNLKISFHKNLNYYIEVSRLKANQVPDFYIRLQTLMNSERFTTEELTNKSGYILNADDKAKELEYEAFNLIKDETLKYILNIKEISESLSVLDVLCSFSKCAIENNYTKPIINQGKQHLYFKDNRHPVAEKLLDNYITNDINLDADKNMMLITGPNASGKSTYEKSIALTILMAQIGSFIPCTESSFNIVDRIFTRIGASDNLVNGDSTFVLELKEMNQALKYGTENSLIIIDELGRGTSVSEGIALSRSILSYIHNHICARSLIATHYHELTELSNELLRIENYSMKVHEHEDTITFLHKMEKGKAGKSYAIYCAKICNLPEEIINLAEQYLNEPLQSPQTIHVNVEDRPEPVPIINYSNAENSLFSDYHLILDKIENIDLLNTTPMDAIMILSELKSIKKNLSSN